MILCLLIWNAVLLILAYIFCSSSSRFSLKSTFSEHYGFWGLLPSPESGDFLIIWQYQCYLALLNFVLHTRSTSSTILGAARKQKLYCSHLCNPVTRTQLALSMLELMKMRQVHGRHPWNSSHFFCSCLKLCLMKSFEARPQEMLWEFIDICCRPRRGHLFVISISRASFYNKISWNIPYQDSNDLHCI